jgi:hypothetical protein
VIRKHITESFVGKHDHAVIPSKMRIIPNSVVIDSKVPTIGSKEVVIYKSNRGKNTSEKEKDKQQPWLIFHN